MKYLLTGATGFIGTAIALRLTRSGHSVRALVRRTSNRSELAALSVEFAEGDVTDAASVRAATDGVDVVVHVAGIVKALSPADFYRVNEGGTRNVARAAADAKVKRLIYVSSLTAGGPAQRGRPRREEDASAPVNHYGWSKLAGETAVREVATRVSSSVVRPPTVYGPRDREFLLLVLRTAKLGVYPVLGLRTRRYSMIHCDDLADLVVLAVEKGRPLGSDSDGLYYGADGGEYTHQDWAALAGEAVGSRPLVVPVPVQLALLGMAYGTARMRLTGQPDIKNFDKYQDLKCLAWTCSAERAARELGFAPKIGARQGFKDAATWFRANGLL